MDDVREDVDPIGRHVDDDVIVTAGDRDRCARRVGVRRGLKSVDDDGVHGRFDGGRQALGDRAVHVDRDRQRLGERGDGGADARLAEHGWEDPVGKLTQLGERLRDLARRRSPTVDQSVAAVCRGCRTRPSQIVGEAEQALLSTVVEVTFEHASALVACFDDAFPGLLEVVHLGEHFGLEALVVEREAQVEPSTRSSSAASVAWLITATR